jgi:hypothetical protein
MDASPLSGWDNFYVIVGSSAGGLTGLTFVVIALIRDLGRVRPTGLGAFVTPTIVHFGGVLALAAFMSMPHQHVPILSGGFAIAGLAGLIYAGSVTARMPSSEEYTPVAEDWIWNAILPALAYGSLLVSAFLIWRHTAAALFTVAGASLLLLFIGIHNSWDIAVWMTLKQQERNSK